MKTWDYAKPRSTREIIELLGADDGRARILAGGTDLLATLRGATVPPHLIVDIKGVEELFHLERTAEGLSIGAAVILNRLIEEQDATRGHAALLQAVRDLGSYPIRNRATLVGNVANASPCADSVPPLCVMGGEVEIEGNAGLRRLPVAAFITGNRQTQLRQGELVRRVLVPALPGGAWSGFRKRKRIKGHDLALASVALLSDPERRRLRLGIGSCSPAPVLIDLDEMASRPDPDEAIRRAQQQIRPIDDVRASSEYRRDMVTLMVRQLFAEMAQQTSAR